ncbi:non-specific lipid transfer protein GPI-anchored 1-like [Salvia hispanica]|uniref:non-specific lipid transfer protein GPI-anchored 1-like n=1 Tax=Salvia hispanica TaxID=49212 RepID=UPI002009A844|nr:non-specific lipid transfer protein GPI-anchored 1-like [Salvia hispanica]
MGNNTSARFAAAVLCWLAVVGITAETIAEKCTSEFQKVTPCLSFVTAKAQAPGKDCCASATELKEEDPECLCLFIQQVHNGSNAAIKSLGVQEARLLQLPAACNLANATISECPKLLNLPPNSTEAAIFTNISATTAPVVTPGTPSTSGATSNGDWHKPQVAGCVAMAIFLLGLMPS